MPRLPFRPATFSFTAAAMLLPLPVAAHPGHLGTVDGHGHWLAAAALGGAIVIGAWQVLRRRSTAPKDGERRVAGKEATTGR